MKISQNDIVLLICMFITTTISANNIQVTNISLLDQETTANTTQVQFDLSWENSWRISSGPSNYDGAWVFIKFRTTGGNWRHAEINYVDGSGAGDGHVVPAGAVVRTTSDGVGAFIYRDADGSGDISFSGIQLRWDYGASFVSDDAVVDVRVYAIEMVYVPTGSFPLGSPNSGNETGRFYYNTGVFGAQAPFPVNSEGAITVSSAVGSTNLYYDSSGDQLGPIPAGFPKGFQAFWSMKYEMSEDQYVGFFNTLTETQKSNHDITGPTGKNTDFEFERNTIAYTSGNMTTSAPNRAVSFLSYEDCAAYLDWAGLRFLTEMEYEKACKGPVHTPNMFASGYASVHSSPYTMINDGTENELISNMGLNITNMNYGSTDPGGPVRVGVFAASAINHTREETGGSYYGIMELSGNLWERTMSAGTPVNRTYTGLHGDGQLTSAGDHNVANWPAVGSQGNAAFRGGGWANNSSTCWVADRLEAANPTSPTSGLIGIRGCRTGE